MRKTVTRGQTFVLGELFRLSRQERDHIAGHALDSIQRLASSLAGSIQFQRLEASSEARKIAALSNFLGDIGWEREARGHDARPECNEPPLSWLLGDLFPTAQLRPWLEQWQREDDKALAERERELEVFSLERDADWAEGEGERRQAIADAQTKLGTGAILLARLEKWMASHGN